MPSLTLQLELERCPHCQVDKPSLNAAIGKPLQTTTHTGAHGRFWRFYKCQRCGGIVTAASNSEKGLIEEMYPDATVVSEAIPEPASNYLQQAVDSLHTPAASVMVANSAVDAMLKEKGHKKGWLNSRIDKAVEQHLITKEMGQWAHNIRLDANEPRHADEDKPLPSADDAKRCVEFALALGEFLFVLPSRVSRGLKDATEKKEPTAPDSDA